MIDLFRCFCLVQTKFKRNCLENCTCDSTNVERILDHRATQPLWKTTNISFQISRYIPGSSEMWKKFINFVHGFLITCQKRMYQVCRGRGSDTTSARLSTPHAKALLTVKVGYSDDPCSLISYGITGDLTANNVYGLLPVTAAAARQPNRRRLKVQGRGPCPTIHAFDERTRKLFYIRNSLVWWRNANRSINVMYGIDKVTNLN